MDLADSPEASYEHHPVEDMEPLSDLTEEQNRLFLSHMRRVLKWIWNDGRGTPTLGMLRAAVVAYIVSPEMFGSPTQGELARMLGRKNKQSINREMGEFRKEFDGFHNGNMRGNSARENMAKAYKKHERNSGSKIEGDPGSTEQLSAGDKRSLCQRGVQGR